MNKKTITALQKKRKLKLFVWIALLLAAIGLAPSFLKEKPSLKSVVEVPISFFPFSWKPRIPIQIEGRKLSVQIDLGSSHPLDLRENVLKKVKKKDLIGIYPYTNVKGNSFSTPAFSGIKITIEGKCEAHAPVFQESGPFLAEAKIWPEHALENRILDFLEPFFINGRIGWTIFKEACCLFDYPNSKLYIAQSINRLLEEGLIKDDWAKIPLHIESFGLVCLLETELGKQKFLLDTGSSLSFIKNSVEKASLAKKSRSGKSFLSIEKLLVDNVNLGKWEFWLYDLAENFGDVDGILGLDFFMTHKVCIDFCGQTAYIPK